MRGEVAKGFLGHGFYVECHERLLEASKQRGM